MAEPRTPSIVALMGSRSLFGAERANIDLLRMMQETGARVTCVVRDEEWPENLHLRRFLEQHGLEWRACAFASYPTCKYWRYWPHVMMENFRAYTEGSRRISQICEEVKATHIHSFNPFMTFSFHKFIKNVDIPLIYRSGEVPVYHNLFYRYIWNIIKTRAAHVGTESEYLLSTLMRIGFKKNKISVIRTPPPLRLSTNIKKIDKLRNLQSVDGLKFCFIGQIEEFKGVGILLESFKITHRFFPDIRLIVAGSLGSDWAKAISAQSRNTFPDGAINFVGHVEDIPAMLDQCDVHVAPSLKPEGYGLVAVEAKQAERPSIVFAGGGLGELVEHEVDGIVVQDKTPEALAEAMLTYCRDPQRVHAHGLAAKASLTQRLGTDRYAEKWRAIYDSTMI